MNEHMQVAREKVLEILQNNGIKRAAFFGSIVRGEMTDESDIDILVEFEGRKSPLPRRLEARSGGCSEKASRSSHLQVAASHAKR
ncbi:MAG: nucleotidyltransferase domain-containing protein [Methanothrix sp.]|nr:nucleotidyltransferase domain-containing protein [Methanothrix sp.]